MSSLEEALSELGAAYERAKATGQRNANAMSLATVDADGRPAVRMVLLRALDERGLVFYTDVRSALGVGWGANGTLEPFLSIGSDGLLLNNQNPDIDVRRFIKQALAVTRYNQERSAAGSRSCLSVRKAWSRVSWATSRASSFSPQTRMPKPKIRSP